IATALGAGGWQVTIAGRKRERLEAAAASLKGAYVQVVDVTDADAVAAAIGSAAHAAGPVQLLVNNAGSVSSAPFEKTSLETWRQTFDLNLMGAVHCARAVL